eukprot:gnl/Dysnectes_brevis/1097_a1228_5375.p1 GENE.gnl/Dysnectes_brevis/1097_a1228_5375~~gnl/Dysnectes_brevis/1097_a1228_5375.p1  ORF type:complete len:141 (+),score=3.86 gnl/Dysnectes_brevis/1097_a1228_5375:51-473(+)
MCKHILNAQVQVYAKCCGKWFDCSQCHAEKMPDHPIEKDMELVMICKKCKKVFRVDMTDFDEDADGHCPRCDNCWYLEAKTPQQTMQMKIEVEAVDGANEHDLIRDVRDPGKERRRMKMLEERLYQMDDGLDILQDDSDF